VVHDYRRLMDQLAELRERRALTLRELAEMSGVAADTINQIELGHRKPRPSTLRKLARALEVDVEELMPPKAAAPPLPPPESADEEWREAAREEVILNVEDARDIEHLFNHLVELYGDLLAQRTDLRDKRIEIDIHEDNSAEVRLMPSAPTAPQNQRSAPTGRFVKSARRKTQKKQAGK